MTDTTPPPGYYVAPLGLDTHDGSYARPWPLAYALSGARGRILPGDTVWLRGGVYAGVFRGNVSGVLGYPVVLRQYPKERATVDGAIRLDGHDVTLWGFEVMRSQPDSLLSAKNLPGIEARGARQKFVNLVIHDGGQQGITFWDEAVDSEIHGCIVYNNGTHENLDHGTYVHNHRGTKLIEGSVWFNNLAYGIHVYAGPGDAVQRNVRVVNNIAFNNGTISTRYTAKGNVIIGAEVPDDSMEVLDNLLYFSGSAGVNLTLGYGNVANGYALARNNALWGGIPLKMTAWPHAQIEQSRPQPTTLTTVIVRNRYEPRAFVAVFNPERLDSARVSLAGVLSHGDRYEVRNVQDLWGAVSGGTYEDSVTIRLGGVQPPPVWGQPSRSPWTGPLFDVFLITRSIP